MDDESQRVGVWSLKGHDSIEARTQSLAAEAESEVVLVLGDELTFTDELASVLEGLGAEVDILVGAVDESLAGQIRNRVPSSETYVTGLEWLHSDDLEPTDPSIGRLLLVDRSALMISTVSDDLSEEQAVFAQGLSNGLIVISRRLMAQGLPSIERYEIEN
jgi:hypothetical protein